jgi:hypothetical protein
MSRYAARTKVPITKSRLEIESTVARYKADQFGTAMATDKAMVQFRIDQWMVRFILPLPKMDEQDRKQRWRALCLSIKAKLESVESRITTFEQEFLPHIVLPDGQTIAEKMIPQLKDLREQGKMPAIDMLEHKDAENH